MKTLLRHPLLWLGVTDFDALAQCPARERHKQATLGGFVLSSSFLAAVGTFGTARDAGVGVPIAAVAAIVLALVIMNFDRYVLASARRQDTWWKTLLGTAPRLTFALAAGQVVTMAVLLFLFSGTVAARVATDRQHALDSAQALIETQKKPIDKLVAERNRLEAEVADPVAGSAVTSDPRYRALVAQQQTAQAKADKAAAAALCERDGTCGSGRFGAGGNYVVKQQRADELQTEADRLAQQVSALSATLLAQAATAKRTKDRYDTGRIAELQRQIVDARKRLRGQQHDLLSVTQRYDGPLARWDALGELAHEHASMRSFKFWVWLTLLLLDTSPALMKTLQLLGRMAPYERALEAADDRVVADLDEQLRDRDVDRELAAEAVERRKRTQTEVAEHRAAKETETAKHRIDLAAATEQEASRLLDEGQRARNLREIEELNERLDPVTQEMSRQRWAEWLRTVEEEQSDPSTPPWAQTAADDDDFASAVRRIFPRNRRHAA